MVISLEHVKASRSVEYSYAFVVLPCKCVLKFSSDFHFKFNFFVFMLTQPMFSIKHFFLTIFLVLWGAQTQPPQSSRPTSFALITLHFVVFLTCRTYPPVPMKCWLLPHKQQQVHCLRIGGKLFAHIFLSWMDFWQIRYSVPLDFPFLPFWLCLYNFYLVLPPFSGVGATNNTDL